MALSLGIQSGSQIQIGDSIMRVIEVARDGKLVHIEVTGKRFSVSDEERTEILDDVFVQVGIPTNWNTPLRSRLAFEAPRCITINRLGVMAA